jgi:multimeric flavodoxin WrbA
MKVILVNGSPIKNGCCERALEEIAAALKADGVDSLIYWLGDKPIADCKACGYCKVKGECVIKDGVQDFLALAKDADGFVFAGPVYYTFSKENSELPSFPRVGPVQLRLSTTSTNSSRSMKCRL